MRTLGCIASIAAPPDGREIVQVWPLSWLRSKWIRHVLGVSGVSVLLGAMIVPSAKRTGLFLMGPRIPSGSRLGVPQVRPESEDVRTMPHHARGFGPTL